MGMDIRGPFGKIFPDCQTAEAWDKSPEGLAWWAAANRARAEYDASKESGEQPQTAPQPQP